MSTLCGRTSDSTYSSMIISSESRLLDLRRKLLFSLIVVPFLFSDAAETNSKKKLKGEKGAVTSSSSARCVPELDSYCADSPKTATVRPDKIRSDQIRC